MERMSNSGTYKKKGDLYYNSLLSRNLYNNSLTFISGILAIIAILPLILVLTYVVINGASEINLAVLTQLPEPPGEDLPSAGGIGNAIIGTIVVSGIASLIAIPIGVGGGIYLAEYSRGGTFSKFIRFGANVLSGVPSIIAGVCIYSVIVSTRIILGSNFSALAGGISLSILMLPTIIKTTDEGLKLVSDDLRKAALGVGASKFVTVSQITIPAAFTPIGTGIVLALARAAGETAPLIFTALFSFYWLDSPEGILQPIATLSVLIYNFAIEPYKAQNELAWAASFLLVAFVLSINLLTRWIGKRGKH